MKSLRRFEWPGNIRELQNRLQQALVKAKIDGSLELQANYLLGDVDTAGSLAPVTFSDEKDKWESHFIAEQLANNSWNITRTAAVLEMSRSHLNRLIKEYNIQKPK